MLPLSRLATALLLSATTLLSATAMAEEARYNRSRCAPRSIRKSPTT